MRLIRLLYSESRWAALFAITVSILGGMATMAVLIILFHALHERDIGQWELFVAACIVAIVARSVSQKILGIIGRATAFRWRRNLSLSMSEVPLRDIEALGSGKLLRAVIDDAGRIAAATPNLIVFISSSTLAIACIAYLGWLSWPRLLIVSILIGLGALSYRYIHRRGLSQLRRTNEVRRTMVQTFRELIMGAKELQLSELRRLKILDDVTKRGLEFQESGSRQGRFFRVSTSVTQALFYIGLGSAFIAMPGEGSDSYIPIGFSISLVYMMAPLQAALNAYQRLADIEDDLRNLEKLGLDLLRVRDAHRPTHLVPDRAGAMRVPIIEFKEVGFRYGAAEESFGVGPLDLDLRPGEVTFIVGGNGSGKTTFAKVIAGLYAADEGQICLNGAVVQPNDLAAYRQNFAAVFADFHVFQKVTVEHGLTDENELASMVQDLKLAERVKIVDGVLENLHTLSTGERKRVGFLQAYLENKGVYLFDEWAADQEPDFKRYFYCDLLQKLKAAGKVVVVISHDDRFFHLADQVLTLERGLPARLTRKAQDTMPVEKGAPRDPHCITSHAEASR